MMVRLAEMWNAPSRNDGVAPKQLCLAFGLREAWCVHRGEEKTHGLLQFVKESLRTRCKLDASTSALHQYFKQFDADPE